MKINIYTTFFFGGGGRQWSGAVAAARRRRWQGAGAAPRVAAGAREGRSHKRVRILLVDPLVVDDYTNLNKWKVVSENI